MYVDVIIVNWNSGNQLLECVNSVRQYGALYAKKIIVVDNGSIDGSENAVKDILDVTVISAGENLGFAKACNLGAKYAQSDYLLFLNPDAALYKDTLSKCVLFMEQVENSQIGICGVQLIDGYGQVARSCAEFPTVGKLIAHTIGVSYFIPKLGYFMNTWDHMETREVDHVIGAFYLVRSCVFDELKGFDERFFVYLEDLDFSYRAKQKGWKSIYLADAQAFHFGGGTSNQVKASRLFYSLRSRIQYAFKHYDLFGAILVLIVTLLIEPFSRLIYSLMKFSWPSIKETLEAYVMLLHWLPNLKRC